MKQKRAGIEYKEQLEEAKAEMSETAKDNRLLKEELKTLARKYDNIEE